MNLAHRNFVSLNFAWQLTYVERATPHRHGTPRHVTPTCMQGSACMCVSPYRLQRPRAEMDVIQEHTVLQWRCDLLVSICSRNGRPYAATIAISTLHMSKVITMRAQALPTRAGLVLLQYCCSWSCCYSCCRRRF